VNEAFDHFRDYGQQLGSAFYLIVSIGKHL